MHCGTFPALLAGKAVLKEFSFGFSPKTVMLALLISIQGGVTLYLQFKALDYLTANDMNGIFFPVAVGLCIAGYSILSRAFFNAKISLPGMFAILAGIGAYCLAAI